jgi:hypothetical protein
VTTSTLVLALTVGAAALALWTYVRFDARGPEGVGASVLHVAAALVLVNAVGPLLMQPIVGDGKSVLRTLVALFAVFLPPLVYTFLSGLWALSGFARRLRPG